MQESNQVRDNLFESEKVVKAGHRGLGMGVRSIAPYDVSNFVGPVGILCDCVVNVLRHLGIV